MKKNKIGKTGLEVTPLTLGTWVFGGAMWSGAKEDECIAAVKAAIDAGINCIDTAPIYSEGVSEEIIGKAIKGRREKVILATKCGLKPMGGTQIDVCLEPSFIMEEIENSLRRLQTEYIDLYQCHWPDDHVGLEDTFAALSKLKKDGKIKYIGVSNYGKDRIEHALQYAEIVSSQDQYSLLSREVESELLPYLREESIAFLAYGPLAGGILTGKYDKPPKFKKNDARTFFYKFYEGDPFKRVQRILDGLKTIGKPVHEIALNWVRQQPGVTTVLVGCRTPAQVQANVKALQWELSAEQLKMINGLLS